MTLQVMSNDTTTRYDLYLNVAGNLDIHRQNVTSRVMEIFIASFQDRATYITTIEDMSDSVVLSGIDWDTGDKLYLQAISL